MHPHMSTASEVEALYNANEFEREYAEQVAISRAQQFARRAVSWSTYLWLLERRLENELESRISY